MNETAGQIIIRRWVDQAADLPFWQIRAADIDAVLAEQVERWGARWDTHYTCCSRCDLMNHANTLKDLHDISQNQSALLKKIIKIVSEVIQHCVCGFCKHC